MIAGEPGRASVVIRVLCLPHGEGLPLPYYHSEHAAGLDVVAGLAEDEPLELAPGARVLVPTGFALELPPGYEAQLRPRSGLALKSGVTMLRLITRRQLKRKARRYQNPGTWSKLERLVFG